MTYEQQLKKYLNEEYMRSRTLSGVLGSYEGTLELAIRIAKGESCLDAAYLELQLASLKERTTKAMAISSS
jgi:hypothetical protein